jgi:hypothetical protein
LKDAFGIEDAMIVRENTSEFSCNEQQLLKSIAVKIELANEDGRYSIYSVQGVSDNIKNYLIKRGYSVEITNGYASISWGN